MRCAPFAAQPCDGPESVGGPFGAGHDFETGLAEGAGSSSTARGGGEQPVEGLGAADGVALRPVQLELADG